MRFEAQKGELEEPALSEKAFYALRERVTGAFERPVVVALAFEDFSFPTLPGISMFLMSIRVCLPVLRRGRPTLAVLLYVAM